MLKWIQNLLSDIGQGVLFFNQVIYTTLNSPCTKNQIATQIYKISKEGFATTAMAGFFVGAIMTIQFTLQLNEFSAIGYLGAISTSATLREVGPLLIAFMLSGKVGAFTAAELGTMRVTEQIDAVRCLGANPFQELILPRFYGIVISSFFLLTTGLLLAIVGGFVTGSFFAEVSFQQYLRHIPAIVSLSSVLSGLFKSFIFAVLIATICTYKGYSTTGGAKGVGRSVLQTAVGCMIAIVVSDWVTSSLTTSFLHIWRGE